MNKYIVEYCNGEIETRYTEHTEQFIKACCEVSNLKLVAFYYNAL